MSLTALPVSTTDIQNLETGIQFTLTGNAATEAAAINAATPGGPTVFSYGVQLLASNISLSQVAMADSALMEGVTVAAGTGTGTTNTLALFTTQFLPAQVQHALAFGFNPTVYAAESLGLALADNASFQTNFVSLSIPAFALEVSNLTGVNTNAIERFVTNWENFYTANPAGLHGLTPTEAAYGAAMGDAIGVALLNPTPIGPGDGVSSLPSASFSTLQNEVYNALNLNALTVNGQPPAGGGYKAGVALNDLTPATQFQGSGTSGGVFLTQGVDTTTAGFTNNPNTETPLLNGFTATQAGQVLTAVPFVTALGLANNTLNVGDNLLATGAAAGTAVLDYTASSAVAVNPAFVLGLVMNGVGTANITNDSAATVAGFEGNITGLTTAGTDNSLFGVRVGNPGGQGLKTALTNVNIVDYVGPTKSATPVITAIIASAAGSASNTIDVGITGPFGSTAAASAGQILIENDGPTGTVANPNLSYGTWAVTADSTSLLQLAQGGVGGAAKLTLGGAAPLIAVGQDAVGNWQNLTTLDLSKTTGIAVITGASTGATNALGTGAAGTNPDWLFGSLAGLLNNGATFDLTSVTLGTGKNVIDVSSATAAEVGALKTTGAVVPGNELIVQDSVATTTSATTFANIAGFEVLGIGGPAAAEGASGAIDMKNLPTSIDTIQYTTKAGAGALVITDQSAALTVNVENNSAAANSLTVGDPPGLADNFHFIIGNAAQVAGGAIGDVTLLGNEVVEYTSTGSVGATTVLNTAGGLLLTPSLTGNEVVTIDGDATLHLGFNTGQGAVTDFTGLALNLNNLTVDVTNTAETLWEEGTPGTLLNFKTDTAGNAPVISYSSNAVIIDATKSGGLIDSGFGDANFEHGLTTALSGGDTITGATAPVGAVLGGGTLAVGDVLGGSIGNDTITSNSTTMPDFLYTEGGTDKITLAAAHTGADHVAFYAGNGFIEAGAAGAVASVAGSIAQNVGNLEFVNPGWWGIGAGGASINIDTLANGTGTSLTESTLTGYKVGQDFLDFSSQAWKGNQAPGGVEGLTSDNGAALVHVAGAQVSGTGVAVNAQEVAAGAGLGGSVANPTNFIILTGDTFTGAGQLALDLTNGVFTVHHSAATAATDYNFLVAYQGTTDGFAHIADLHIEGAAGSTNTGTDDRVNASDMVTLVGVTTTQLEANTSHIHLVT